MAERIPSRLFTQLAEAKVSDNVSDEEIAELYEDLKCIFDSTFDLDSAKFAL